MLLAQQDAEPKMQLPSTTVRDKDDAHLLVVLLHLVWHLSDLGNIYSVICLLTGLTTSHHHDMASHGILFLALCVPHLYVVTVIGRSIGHRDWKSILDPNGFGDWSIKLIILNCWFYVSCTICIGYYSMKYFCKALKVSLLHFNTFYFTTL